MMEPSVSCSAPGPPPMMEPVDAPNRIGKMGFLIDQSTQGACLETRNGNQRNDMFGDRKKAKKVV